MRKTLTCLAFAALLISCTSKENTPEEQVGGLPIFFVQEVSTKGTLLADDSSTPALAGKNFSILGFKYDGEWATVKMQSSFTNNGVFGSFPQNVTTDAAGNCTYSDVKYWEDKNYSFFAYYPAELQLMTKTKGDYDKYSEDAPYVYYQLPTYDSFETEEINNVTYTNYKIDPSKTTDIITASVLNTNSLYSYHVPLTFYHRLFCINVKIQNLTEYTLKITKLDVKLSGLKYGAALFPLDDQNNSVITENYNPEGTNPVCVFEILNNTIGSKEIPGRPEGSTTMNEVVIDGPDNDRNIHDRNILLIPQEESLTFHGAIKLTYQRPKNTGEDSGENTGEDNETVNIDSGDIPIVGVEDLTYRAGRKYTISIIYSENSITVTMGDAGEWTDKIQNIIFE